MVNSKEDLRLTPAILILRVTQENKSHQNRLIFFGNFPTEHQDGP